jgi:hypothetical protein
MKTSQRPSSQKKIFYGSKKLSPPIPLLGLHLLVHTRIYPHTYYQENEAWRGL